jgi:hypothetical protein
MIASNSDIGENCASSSSPRGPIMSTPDVGSEIPKAASSERTRSRNKRRILTLAIGAAAFLAAGSIVMACVGKIQDAADRTH